MSSRVAHVYQLKDRLLIHPLLETTAGVLIAAEPYATLSLETEAHGLGHAVLAALAHSGRTVPHPTDWKAMAAPRLKAAGVRSEKAFQTGTRNVFVERDDRGFQVESTRNGGAKGEDKGFAPLPDSIALPLAATPEQLGAAIRVGLAKCQ